MSHVRNSDAVGTWRAITAAVTASPTDIFIAMYRTTSALLTSAYGADRFK
jgi:hypothetical protein